MRKATLVVSPLETTLTLEVVDPKTLPPPPPPQTPLYSQNTDVTLITLDTLSLYIKQTPHVWLLKFFRSDCRKCHEIAPAYEKVAKSLKHVVHVGAVDCAGFKEICDEYDVTRVPTIILIPYGIDHRNDYRRYEGDLTSHRIYDFALTGLPKDHITILRLTKDLTTFCQDPNNPKVLLYSQKSDPPPLYVSLSLLFRDHVSFGFVPRDSAAGSVSMEDHTVLDWPTLVAISPDEKEKRKYEGEMNYPDLSLFVNQFMNDFAKKSFKESSANYTELNSATLLDQCPPDSKWRCGILIGGDALTDTNTDLMKKLVVKYAHDPIRFMWVVGENSEEVRQVVNDPEIRFLVYNPKNRKGTWTQLEDEEGVVKFLDRVLGGGEKWKILDELKMRV